MTVESYLLKITIIYHSRVILKRKLGIFTTLESYYTIAEALPDLPQMYVMLLLKVQKLRGT